MLGPKSEIFKSGIFRIGINSRRWTEFCSTEGHESGNDCVIRISFFKRPNSAFPCRLIVDPHEWLNDSSTVPRWNPANLLLW